MNSNHIWPITTLVQTNRRVVPFGMIRQLTHHVQSVDGRTMKIDQVYQFVAVLVLMSGMLLNGWAVSKTGDGWSVVQLIAALCLMFGPTLMLYAYLVRPRTRVLRAFERCRVHDTGEARLSKAELAQMSAPDGLSLSKVLTNRIDQWRKAPPIRSSLLIKLWVAAGSGWFVSFAVIAWTGQHVHTLPESMQPSFGLSMTALLASDALAVLLLVGFFAYYAGLPFTLKQRMSNGECPGCRYDLTATDTAAQVEVKRCPECGLAMPFVPLMPASEWRALLEDNTLAEIDQEHSAGGMTK